MPCLFSWKVSSLSSLSHPLFYSCPAVLMSRDNQSQETWNEVRSRARERKREVKQQERLKWQEEEREREEKREWKKKKNPGWVWRRRREACNLHEGKKKDPPDRERLEGRWEGKWEQRLKTCNEMRFSLSFLPSSLGFNAVVRIKSVGRRQNFVTEATAIFETS